MEMMPASGRTDFRAYQSREGQVGALIELVGATMDASEKIIVHYADFDLFTGLSWLHSLRGMQLNTRGTCSPYGADGW